MSDDGGGRAIPTLTYSDSGGLLQRLQTDGDGGGGGSSNSNSSRSSSSSARKCLVILPSISRISGNSTIYF